MLRSLKTLGIRMERQQENAQRIAQWLCQQDIVTHVYYVGLPDHPGYELNCQQSTGSGAMIFPSSFSYAILAQRSFVDLALPLLLHSSADGRITSLEISAKIPSL